jgi:hypothetical protein
MSKDCDWQAYRSKSVVTSKVNHYQSWLGLNGRIVIGLDGGYIRDRNDRKKNFELIVGRSLPEDDDSRYIGFVHGYDRKPQRRILDHLKKQGVQANQDITFITDGGEEVRSLAEMIAPHAHRRTPRFGEIKWIRNPSRSALSPNSPARCLSWASQMRTSPPCSSTISTPGAASWAGQ